MKQIELIEWVIAGINAEIDKLATARIKGYSLLDVVKRYDRILEMQIAEKIEQGEREGIG